MIIIFIYGGLLSLKLLAYGALTTDLYILC